MNVLILSDIHANLVALEALKDDLARANVILHLGDVVGYYCQVNETIDQLRVLGARCVLGNHDDFVLHGGPAGLNPAVQFGIDFADRVITPENRQWLAALPLSWGGVIGGRRFLLSHGSPWKPLQDYLYADNPLLNQLADFDYDVIAFGQTHRGLLRTDQRPHLLNPGSVGQSRDRTALACAVMLHTPTMTYEIIERAYDVHAVMALARQHGAGEWIGKHLV